MTVVEAAPVELASYTVVMNRRGQSTVAADEIAVVRSVLAVNDRLGVREWVRGLDYFRCAEYPLVLEALRPASGHRLLDMGCGSGPFAVFLALELGYCVEALDLDPECVAWQVRAASRLGLDPTAFSATEGDSRALPHPDATFDVVLNLGSIEHIRSDGDSLAAREMARVLKPGGRAVVTVPYGTKYELIDSGPHVPDFERRYDDSALQQRLLTPSTLVETERIYFGEPDFRASSIWYGTPRILRLPLRRITPRLARRWLARIPHDERSRACGVCLVLDKAL
jgi:SAM-dependent methyltransferase